MKKVLAVLALLGVSSWVFANNVTVPEPGMLELLGVGVVVAAAAWLSKRRK